MTDKDRNKTIAILQTTKQVLTDTPWCQGAYVMDENNKPIAIKDVVNGIHQGEYQVCLLGAYGMAKHKHQEYTHPEGQMAILAAITEKIGRHTSVPAYNDDKERTKEEVIGIIDRAIEMLENNEIDLHSEDREELLNAWKNCKEGDIPW